MRNNLLSEQLLALEKKELTKFPKKDSWLRAFRKSIGYCLKYPQEFSSLIFPKHKTTGKMYVGIKAGGGMGDLLRANSLIQAFSLQYPNILFDVFLNSPEKGKFLFGELPNVENIYYEHLFLFRKSFYSFTISTLQVAQVKGKNIPQEIIDVQNRVKDLLDLYNAHGEFSYHYIVRNCIAKGLDFMDVLGLTAGINQMGDKKAILPTPSLTPVTKKYFTFSTSSNIRDGANEQATKCWPHTYWVELIAKLKATFPTIECIQLGEENATAVAGANVTYLGKTNLQTMLSIMKGSLLHLDCDCGLVHIAKAVGVKSVVLFGPSSSEYVGYRGNCNIASPYCGNCWHTTESWNIKCPLGFKKAKCMDALTPEIVFKKMIEFIKKEGII